IGLAPTDESDEPEQPVASASATAEAGERPALRVVGGTASRAERYYKAAAQPPAVPLVSQQELDLLRALQAAGDTANLILAFGPHAGESLGQVARNDPDYLR